MIQAFKAAAGNTPSIPPFTQSEMFKQIAQQFYGKLFSSKGGLSELNIQRDLQVEFGKLPKGMGASFVNAAMQSGFA